MLLHCKKKMFCWHNLIKVVANVQYANFITAHHLVLALISLLSPVHSDKCFFPVGWPSSVCVHGGRHTPQRCRPIIRTATIAPCLTHLLLVSSTVRHWCSGAVGSYIVFIYISLSWPFVFAPEQNSTAQRCKPQPLPLNAIQTFIHNGRGRWGHNK